MPWYIWLIVIDMALTPFVRIAQIGREREPYGPADAIAALIVAVLFVWAIVHVTLT